MKFPRPVRFWLCAKSSLLLGQDTTLSVTNVTQIWWRKYREGSSGGMRQMRGNKKDEAEKKESQNVVRQKETRATPWRPLWHDFPECSLIAGG